MSVSMSVNTTSPASAAFAELDDAQLMLAVARGDKGAFTEIVTRHLNALIQFAMRYVGRRVDAEDAAQEAFIRIWNSAANWQPQGYTVRSWMYRITYNLCIDQLRKRKSVTSIDDEQTLPAQDEQSEPDNELSRDQQQQAVTAAMDQLPERQRTAIALVVYHSLSNRDAAAVMDVSVEALESLLARGRRTLKKIMLEQEGS